MDYYIYKIEELERQAKNEIDQFKKISCINPEKIVFLNIETTGLNKCEILKITILNGNRKILFDKLIKPSYTKTWPIAEKINNITPDMVKDEKTFFYYKNIIKKILENADAVICWCPDFIFKCFLYKKQEYKIKNLVNLQEIHSIINGELFLFHDCDFSISDECGQFKVEKCYTYKKMSLTNCCNVNRISADDKIEKLYLCYLFIDEYIQKEYMKK